MPGVNKPLLRSFAAGEITPELFGRIDLDKVQSGLLKCLNARPLPTGPVQNRAGFQYVNEVAGLGGSTGRARVIPFAFSATQTMVLEFTSQLIRFHTQGQSLLEGAKSITGITNAGAATVTINAHGYVGTEWVYLSNILGMTDLNNRFFVVGAPITANTFTIYYVGGLAVNTTAMPAYAGAGLAARQYEVTTSYQESDLMDLHYTQSADVLTITHPSYAPMELRRLGATNWTLTAASFTPAIAAPAVPVLAPIGPGGGAPINHTYKTTAVSSDTFEESLPSVSATLARDLTVAGNAIDITPAVVAGAIRYNVYALGNGGLYGFIGQSDGTNFRDNNITPDLSQSPPETSTPFVGAGNYPSTCTYMEQRKCFAATNNKPQNVWMTHSATEGNLSQSVPVRDSDAIIFRIAASQQNRIRHLVPLVDLIALTVGSEFRIYAANGDVLTPANTTPKPQSYVGANNVQPCVAEASILYAQGQGGHVREFAYAGTGINGATYNTNDVSILAPHLFDDHSIVDMAYSRTAACPTLWCVRSDGYLVGMTYVPGQNVRGWHQDNTDGFFESVCVVAEGSEDVLYAIVQRSINGREVRYVERHHTRRFTDKVDAYFVDCGLTYEGAPITTVVGFWHLEGETINLLADGAVIRNLVVTNGRVTLPAAASTIHGGLPYLTDIQTLPVSWQADGFGQGVIKNVGKVHMRLSQSSGVHIGPTDEKLIEVKQRTTEAYGSPPNLINGWKHVDIQPLWQDDGGVVIQQTDPLPITVLCMVLDTVSGG